MAAGCSSFHTTILALTVLIRRTPIPKLDRYVFTMSLMLLPSKQRSVCTGMWVQGILAIFVSSIKASMALRYGQNLQATK